MPKSRPIQDAHLVRQPADLGFCDEHYATLFALANGLIGIKGSIDECAHALDTIVPDAFITRPITYHEAFKGYAAATDTRILCPSPVRVTIEIDGRLVDLSSAQIERFERWLDLETGQLHRITRWTLADGRMLEVTALRLVPLAGDAVIASRFRLMALNFTGDVRLTPGFGLGGAVSNGDAHDPRISGRLQQEWDALGLDPADTKRFQSGDIVLEYRSSITATIGQRKPDANGGAIVAHLGPSDSIAFDRVVHIERITSGPAAPGAIPTFNALAVAQHQAMTRLWERAGCAVEGDDRLTQALRFNLFQLAQSATRNPAHGTAAKGLTGDGYEGHYFWDAEAFMVPALVFTMPERTRALIKYRIGKLDAARANARQLGHTRGALYPWRTIAGGECSSHYPTGAAQYHINGDIAFAVKLYVDATGDEACLRDAAEMLFETARIWFDIGQFDDARDGAFCIYGVTGPDEYTSLVNNDFYTNAVARLHLSYAAEVAEWLSQTNSEHYARLVADLGLADEEIAQWTEAAAKMWLPVDPARSINPQDDGFLTKPPFNAGPLRVAGRPLLLDHHPMTLFRHQVCKQGDVIQALAMGLVDQPLTLSVRNYAYYEPITTHDSTLSAPAFAIVAAQIGAFADARRFLDETAFVDLYNLHHNTSHGLHMAALAGSWLAVAQGWAGLRVQGAELHFRSQSAPELARYRLTVNWRGSTFELSVDEAGATYQLRRGVPVTIFDHSRAIVVTSHPVRVPRPSVQAVIFDLDGVLTDTAEDHYQAWAALAQRHALAFDRQVNEKLKGVDRANSLRLILEHSAKTLPTDTFEAYLVEKNRLYRDRLESYTPAHLFDGVRDLFAGCRMAGLKIALASASKNAATVISQLGIADQFDFVADAGAVAKPKPAPDIFLACAAALGVPPEACVGVEDAQAGIDAINAAGMRAIGIGSAATLSGAVTYFAHIADLRLDQILGCAAHRAPQDSCVIYQPSGEDIS